jgi:3-oxoacyl-[acyl-carrier-protein] synthase-3
MGLLSFKNIRIAGVAASVPQERVLNKEAAFFESEEAYQRFLESTGIASRYVVGDSGLCASDLCVDAAKRLLNSLEWSTDSVDCLVFVTQTPDYLLPATSCIIQDRLGLKPSCYALDISLGCSGWVYGLSVVAALMESGVFKRALLLAGDTTSVTKSPQDRSTFPLFGDAGTATAIEYRENSGTMAFDFGTDGSGYEAIMIKDGGFRNPTTLNSFEVEMKEDGKIRNDLQSILNGPEVFTFGISQAPKSVKQLMTFCGISPENIDVFLFHQANLMMNERIRGKLKLREDQVPYSLHKFGNTSSASLMLTLCHTRATHQANGRFIACGFGVGLSWGSVFFELNQTRILEINFI